ncbi:hypothetical protein BT69DRAFT_1294747 [Atractiella rhizophila]|nr:hypothetical protein BT69DRAFT_1294747 [Atractiella rhizophila]
MDTIFHKLQPSIPLSSDGNSFRDFNHLQVRSVIAHSEEEVRTGTFILVEPEERYPYIFRVDQMLLLQPVDYRAGQNNQELHIYGCQMSFTGAWYKHHQLPLLLPSPQLSRLDSVDKIKGIVNIQHACQIAGEMVERFLPPIPRLDRKVLVHEGVRKHRESKAVQLQIKETLARPSPTLLTLPCFQSGFQADTLSDDGLRALIHQLGGKVRTNVKMRSTLLMNLERTMAAILNALATMDAELPH